MRTLSKGLALRDLLALPLALLLAACSGGSGSTGAGQPSPTTAGSVVVVVDTRASSDQYVQVQVAAAALESESGAVTDNLLPESIMLTVGDPAGEPAGLRLAQVPTGSYRAIRLLLVPDSATALALDGTTSPVGNPVDLRIPITEDLQHSAQLASWLIIGHDTPPLSDQGSTLQWNPVMSARLDGTSVQMRELALPVVQGTQLMATASALEDASLELDGAPDCIYEDEDGTPFSSQQAFFQSLSLDDTLVAHGDLRRDGSLAASRIRRSGRSDRPRLLGTILNIDPVTETFEMRIVATRRSGNQTTLPVPEIATIRAQTARIEASDGLPTTFAALVVDQLVKVKWLSRSTASGQIEYVAEEVEISSIHNSAIEPEWEARVLSVDPATQTIVIVPRNNEPIIIQGASVPQADVLVDGSTVIERKSNQGGGSFPISLSEIQPGTDRIWVRGIAVAATIIEANRIRVRED